MTVQAVIWDLGGVLVRWQPEAALDALYPDPDTARAALVETGFSVWNARLDAGADWDELIAEADAPLATILAAYREGLAAAHLEVFDGSVRLVDRLAEAGVAQYALSNAAARTAETLAGLHPFMGRFRDVVVSGIEGICKPDPAIYRILLNRNGLRPEACLFIDDNASNVAAAQALGLTAHRFTTPEACAEALRQHGLPA